MPIVAHQQKKKNWAEGLCVQQAAISAFAARFYDDFTKTQQNAKKICSNYAKKTP